MLLVYTVHTGLRDKGSSTDPTQRLDGAAAVSGGRGENVGGVGKKFVFAASLGERKKIASHRRRIDGLHGVPPPRG